MFSSKGVIFIMQMNMSSSSSQTKTSEPLCSMCTPRSEGLALMLVERLVLQWAHNTNIKAIVAQLWDQIFASSVLIKFQAKMYGFGYFPGLWQIFYTGLQGTLHCSVHFSHFIFLYIILISVKLLLSVYDASCILRKKIINCNFKTKDREQTGR